MGAKISRKESTCNEKSESQENINLILEPNFDWATVKEKNNGDDDNDDDLKSDYVVSYVITYIFPKKKNNNF